MRKLIAILAISLVSVCFLSGAAEPDESMPEPVPTIEAIDRLTYWQEHPEDSPMLELTEARWLATVADAVAPEGDARCKTAVMQCVLNRTLAPGFPDTVEGVCTQKNQWQGLTRNTQPSTETKKLAREVLEAYRGPATLEVPRNCVYLCKTDRGIEFRATWDSTDTVLVEYEEG